MLAPSLSLHDPSATLAVHCGNGFDARLSPIKVIGSADTMLALSLGADMRRRQFITLLGGAAAWPLAARAQQSGPTVRQARVGVLTASPPTPAMLNAFREGMRERGYIEGQNLSVAVRWPQGSFDQDPGVVTELVSGNVDVIVAWATPTVIAVRRATSTIPIVMVSVADPIGSGFIASLARPGGNITGLTTIAVDLSAKLVELFVELIRDLWISHIRLSDKTSRLHPR
jgi:putative tryptophan/tyrosine transport system substrate-binding protein